MPPTAATLAPKCPPAAPGPANVATSLPIDGPCGFASNRYAAPAPGAIEPSPGAPTTRPVPTAATLDPNPEPGSDPGSRSVASTSPLAASTRYTARSDGEPTASTLLLTTAAEVP